MTGEEAFNLLEAYFRDKAEYKLVILYGSAAAGHFGTHSDVDVAVAGSGAFESELLYSTAFEIAGLLGREVDLIDLHKVEGLILYQVMTKGIRVKTDAKLYVKFRGKALGYKEDFKPFQDMLRNARIRSFIHGS